MYSGRSSQFQGESDLRILASLGGFPSGGGFFSCRPEVCNGGQKVCSTLSALQLRLGICKLPAPGRVVWSFGSTVGVRAT